MKRLIKLLLLVAVFGGLYVTNPTMEDFKAFVRDEAGGIVLEEMGDTELGRILADVGSSLAAGVVERFTDRKDYWIFSVYDLGTGRTQNDDPWRFVGVAGRFIEISRPEK